MPSQLFGGRVRTSTLALIVVFLAVWWVYETYKPQEPARPSAPPAQVVPPGFVPDPNYTWVPRTKVEQQPAPRPRTTTPTPTTTTPPVTTTTTTPPFVLPTLPCLLPPQFCPPAASPTPSTAQLPPPGPGPSPSSTAPAS